MESNPKKALIYKTAGWCTIALGAYLLHKGMLYSGEINVKDPNIIDVDFEIVD